MVMINPSWLRQSGGLISRCCNNGMAQWHITGEQDIGAFLKTPMPHSFLPISPIPSQYKIILPYFVDRSSKEDYLN